MIAAIARGGSAAGLARYLHGPGKANEHAYGGRPGGAVIAGTVGQLGDVDGKGWAKEFHRLAAGHDTVRRPVWHCSLRAAPGDRVLGDAEWRSLAGEFVEAMSVESFPWVAVRHGDDHVHLAVCRVGYDGEVWKGSHDRRAAQAACTAIEQAHHLEAVPRQRSQGRRGPDSQVRAREHAKAGRTGQTPQRVVLAEKVIAVVQVTAGRGRAGFEAECARMGVAATANVASGTGRMSGYTFTDTAVPEVDRLVFKASQLHKCLSWTQLGTVLDQVVEPIARQSFVDATAVYTETRRQLADYSRTWEARKATGRAGRSVAAMAPRRGAQSVPVPAEFGADVEQAAALARAALPVAAETVLTLPKTATPIPVRRSAYDHDPARPVPGR